MLIFKNIIEHWFTKILPNTSFLSTAVNRNEELIFPPFLKVVNTVFLDFNSEKNYMPFVVEGYRSNKLQRIYFNRGASKITSNGMHHFGIAVDVAFRLKNPYAGDYTFLRKLFKFNVITMLTSWDIGHFQYIPINRQSTLRNEIKSSVALFQHRYGLVVDGVAGIRTHTAALSLSPQELAKSFLKNQKK